MRIHVLTKEDTFRSLVSYDKEKKKQQHQQNRQTNMILHYLILY